MTDGMGQGLNKTERENPQMVPIRHTTIQFLDHVQLYEPWWGWSTVLTSHSKPSSNDYSMR